MNIRRKNWESEGLTYFDNQEYGFAEYCFKQLCKTQPSGMSWYYRGLCFRFQQMFESAIYCFNQALKYGYPRDRIYYHIGAVFAGLEHYSQANYYLELASALSLDKVRPMLMKAYTCLKANDIEEYDSLMMSQHDEVRI